MKFSNKILHVFWWRFQTQEDNPLSWLVPTPPVRKVKRDLEPNKNALDTQPTLFPKAHPQWCAVNILDFFCCLNICIARASYGLKIRYQHKGKNLFYFDRELSVFF